MENRSKVSINNFHYFKLICVWDWVIPIHIYFRTSRVLSKICFPSNGISSGIFGGPNMDIMFCTCSNTLVQVYTAELTLVQPKVVGLFMIVGLNAKGYPSRKACVWTFDPTFPRQFTRSSVHHLYLKYILKSNIVFNLVLIFSIDIC